MSLVRAYAWETRKLVRQKRTWSGLGAAVALRARLRARAALKKNAGIPPDIPLASK